MGNTSLKRITIPKLNSNFGESIQKTFEAIDLNFQKLANIGLNQGRPGQSCIYLPINLGAAFIYSPIGKNDTTSSVIKSRYDTWFGYIETMKAENPSRWNEFVRSVSDDYEQFANITGYGPEVYSRIAAMLIWGDEYLFGNGTNVNQGALTPTLEAKYSNVDGLAEFDNGDGTKTNLYGNWMYELYKCAHGTGGVDWDRFRKLFTDHFAITVPGKIIVAFSPIPEGDGISPVGSFEYWYIDPRFRCGKANAKTTAGFTDISCVLHWTPKTFGLDASGTWDGGFEILEIFPTIKSGADGQYYWNINGMDTGVPVNGKDGSDGKAAQLIIVERVENVRGWNPTTAPNGTDFWSPKPGKQTIRTLHYSGAPLSVTTVYPRLADGIELPDNAENNPINARIGNPAMTNIEKVIVEGSRDAGGLTQRIIQYEHTEDDPWLLATDDELDEQIRNPADIQYLHRIFRLVGRTKFWTYEGTSQIPPNEDDYGRCGDPAADEYYGVDSSIDADKATQDLISQLDGAFAIVLPGPSYMGGRTDSTFWFATLKKVRVSTTSDICMLVAFCSPYSQCTTQLDEHSYAGLMQNLDPYTFKATSNNRNKPRGLMLPIGSINAASNTPSNTWAAHIIHSDTGGFSKIEEFSVGGNQELRGYQNVKLLDPSRVISHAGVAHGGAQFSEVYDKRVLHVGSVDDFRTLNFVNEALDNDGGINGGIPGRIALKGEGVAGVNGVGRSTFFGGMINGWFSGTELHVDEPVTITSYRDLFPKGILLNVEGDTIIGPHRHKNAPGTNHSFAGGGLWVASTLTMESIEQLGTSPFSGLLEGKTKLSFDPFARGITQKNEIGRVNNHGTPTKDDNTIIKQPTYNETSAPLFSAIFEDTIGARVVAASDGIIIYNPDDPIDGSNVLFSVDGSGNMQTYGKEIRSNNPDTLWLFHTKWVGKGVNDLTIGSKHTVVDGKYNHYFGFDVESFNPANITIIGGYQNNADSNITYMIGDRYVFEKDAYAESFKRHKHSDFALLLDNGRSMWSAPKATYNNINREYSVDDSTNKYSPLYIDFGKAFGQNRLVKFGVSRADIKVDGSGGIVPDGSGDINDDVFDKNGALVASFASIVNKSKSASGYLFNQPPTTRYKKYGINVSFSSIFGVCKLDIELKIDQMLKSVDWNHHGAHVNRENCYGIATSQAPKITNPSTPVTFQCKVDGTDSTAGSRNHQRDGQVTPDARMNEFSDGIDRAKIIDCNGFNSLNIFDGEFSAYKPPVAQWFPVISMWNGASNCNWPCRGTDSDRGWGKGLWFKLDTNGKLTIPWYSSAGSIFTRATTITISFCWVMGAATNSILWDIARTVGTTPPSTSATASPDIKIGTSTQEWVDWSTGGYKYLWCRKSGTTDPWQILSYAFAEEYILSESCIEDGDGNITGPSGAQSSLGNSLPETINWGSYNYLFQKSSYTDENGISHVDWSLYSTKGDSSSSDDPDESSESWLWGSTTCTAGDINASFYEKYASLKSSIDALKTDDYNVGSLSTITAAYGSATLEKLSSGIRVSLMVTAWKTSETDLSLRIINYVDNNGSISAFSSYIL